MATASIICSRLVNQQLAATAFGKPDETVRCMCAMQAQDFAMAKWAIGLRTPGVKDADVEKAFNEGKILRTHLLRPTWHFVSPHDIRWLIALTAPRVNAVNAYYYRKFGLDAKVFNRSNKAFINALQGGTHLTRTALASALAKIKINADGIRLSCIMMHAELDGVLCSGPRQGKQFTYALLEERVAPAKPLTKQEALTELILRYFASRGPATVEDFANWSGLAITTAKEGVNLLQGKLVKEIINGQEYLLCAVAPHDTLTHSTKPPSTFLMPDYDEYAISYKDRSAIFGAKNKTGNIKDGNPIFSHTLIVDGVAAGSWQRTTKGKRIDVETTVLKPLGKTTQQAVAKAVKKYLEFLTRE